MTSPTSSRPIAEACAWLASQQSQLTADLVELANQNSGSQHLPGLLNLAQWLEDRMNLPHARFQRVPLPPRHVIDDRGDELAIETGPLLRWDYHPERSRRVLLAIHYDTVFGPDDPFQSCQRLTAERLEGPGVADAKGGILVIRAALQALINFELAPEIGWSVVLNPDEEVGSPSSRSALDALAPDFDFGLLFEPALAGGELVSRRKGSGNYTLVVHGQAAHAGRNFQQGRNAVVELCRLVDRLAALNHQWADLTINVGRIVGGGAVNIVPDLAVAHVNIRVADMAAAKWFEQQLARGVASVNARSGFRCLSSGGLASPPKLVTGEMQQLMSAVQQATLAAGGSTIKWKESGGVCDGNKLAAAGLPNVDTLGPIGDGLHSRSEWVDLPSIVARAQTVVHLLSGYSAGEFAALQRQRFEAEAFSEPQ